MGVHDFTETVSCFMRVAWAAAAGKLHLLSSPQPIRESATAYSCGRRSRQSSTGKSFYYIVPLAYQRECYSLQLWKGELR